MNTWKLAKKLRQVADDLDAWKAPPRQDVHLSILVRGPSGGVYASHAVNVPAEGPDTHGIQWDVTIPVLFAGEPVQLVLEARAFASQRTE